MQRQREEAGVSSGLANSTLKTGNLAGKSSHAGDKNVIYIES